MAVTTRSSSGGGTGPQGPQGPAGASGASTVDADGTTRGLMGIVAQSFAGAKTFLGAVVAAAGMSVTGALSAEPDTIFKARATFVGTVLTGDTMLRLGHGSLPNAPNATAELLNTTPGVGKAIAVVAGTVNCRMVFSNDSGVFNFSKNSRASFDAGTEGIGATTCFVIYGSTGQTVFYLGVDTNIANTWTKAHRVTPVAVINASGAIAIDLNASNHFFHTTTADAVLSAPSNAVAGQSGVIEIKQGATAYALTYNAFWKFPGGTVPALTATASAVDFLAYQVSATGTFAVCNLIKGVA